MKGFADDHSFQNDTPHVTVVIPAKNAADTLASCLESIMHQDYPNFNVIVVNDFSDDRTQEIIDQFKSRYAFINSIIPTKDVVGKKLALAEGIELAKEWALLIDADCRATSKYWIQKMAFKMSPGYDLVLGHGALERTQGWINLITRYENIYIAIQYFTAAYLGVPYMGVGRNLAVRKIAFDRIRSAFLSSDMPFGDDDALVHLIANRANTALATDHESFTTSGSPKSFSEYFHQKRRHIRPSFRYSIGQKMMLALLSFSMLGTYIFGVILFLFGFYSFVLLIVFVRLILILITIQYTPFYLKQKDVLFFLPFVDLGLAINYIIQSLFLARDKTEW